MTHLSAQSLLFVPDEPTMLRLGACIAQSCPSKALIYLEGELGVGKTTLVRGMLAGCGYTDRVKSPTYTLVEPYVLTHRTLYHFDLYRLKSPEELEQLGIRDFLAAMAVCIVEWPEQGMPFLPQPDLRCRITFSDSGRNMEFTAFSALGQDIVQTVFREFSGYTTRT